MEEYYLRTLCYEFRHYSAATGSSVTTNKQVHGLIIGLPPGQNSKAFVIWHHNVRLHSKYICTYSMCSSLYSTLSCAAFMPAFQEHYMCISWAELVGQQVEGSVQFAIAAHCTRHLAIAGKCILYTAVLHQNCQSTMVGRAWMVSSHADDYTCRNENALTRASWAK